jgi:uncharacterized membrane protein
MFLFIFFKKRLFASKKQWLYNMNMITQEKKLAEYLRNSLAQGYSKENIYKKLLGQGWTIEEIQKSFDLIGKNEEKEEDTSKKTIRVIVTIGAVLIGVGIFSSIVNNWFEITRPIKITIILVSMITSYGLGWYLKENFRLQKTGEALILLGSIIYGSGIFLVAQIFEVQTNWPDGFILWMIGIIAMAFAIQSYSLFYLAISLGVIAIFGHFVGILISFEYSQFLFTSSFLLLVATIITFFSGRAIRKKMPSDSKSYY